MSDSEDDRFEKFRPQNVTERQAEAYLIATGWLKDPFTREDDPLKWMPPWYSAGKKFTRGQAVMQQYKADVSRLVFVMQHAPPEVLQMFIPPSVIEKIAEHVAANMPKPPDQPPN